MDTTITRVARWAGGIAMLVLVLGCAVTMILGLPEAIITASILLILLIGVFVFFRKGPRQSPEPMIAAAIYGVLLAIAIPKLLALYSTNQLVLFADTTINIIVGSVSGMVIVLAGIAVCFGRK